MYWVQGARAFSLTLVYYRNTSTDPVVWVQIDKGRYFLYDTINGERKKLLEDHALLEHRMSMSEVTGPNCFYVGKYFRHSYCFPMIQI